MDLAAINHRDIMATNKVVRELLDVQSKQLRLARLNSLGDKFISGEQVIERERLMKEISTKLDELKHVMGEQP